MIVDKAHKKNISVEAELGILSGQEDDIDVDEQEANLQIQRMLNILFKRPTVTVWLLLLVQAMELINFLEVEN